MKITASRLFGRIPKNQNLYNAKQSKNDEFYTLYEDIEKEVSAYVEYNPDVFRDKVILLPCDDYGKSQFTQYFIDNYDKFGIKELISTCYIPDGKGKIFTLRKGEEKRDTLQGDGDFRSKEVSEIRDRADIIITNPPFSLFRDFFKWIIEVKKQFLIMGNINAIMYTEVFPFIKDNVVYVVQPKGGHMCFTTPIGESKLGFVRWFTNIDHGRRHKPLPLMTMKDNIKYSKHKIIKERGYVKYDNYDAIEVPFVDAIPSDYKGVMGVPITFIDKHCPEQFEIVGACGYKNRYNLKTKVYTANDCKQAYFNKFGKKGTSDLNVSGVSQPLVERRSVYKRIFIKHKGNR